MEFFLLRASFAARWGGWLGDKYAQKLVLAASLWLYALGLGLGWLSDTLTAYYFVFVLVGLASAGFIIADLALVLEFTPPSHRPTYMGIARGVLGPWVGLALIVGGIVLSEFNYTVMLVTSIVLTVVGLFLVMARVREPRTQATLRTVPVAEQ